MRDLYQCPTSQDLSILNEGRNADTSVSRTHWNFVIHKRTCFAAAPHALARAHMHIYIYIYIYKTTSLFQGLNLNLSKISAFVGYEVLTAVVMNSSVFWDITPCSPLKVN
jgi:hypothetical protein